MARKHEHFGLSYLEELKLLKERENICKESRQDFLKSKQETAAASPDWNKPIFEVTPPPDQTPEIEVYSCQTSRSPQDVLPEYPHHPLEAGTSKITKKVRISLAVTEKEKQIEDVTTHQKKSPKKEVSVEKKQSPDSGKAVLECKRDSQEYGEKLPVAIASLVGTSKQLTILRKPEPPPKPKYAKVVRPKVQFKSPVFLPKVSTYTEQPEEEISEHAIEGPSTLARGVSSFSVVSSLSEKSSKIGKETSKPSLISSMLDLDKSHSKKSSSLPGVKPSIDSVEETFSGSRSKIQVKHLTQSKSQIRGSVQKLHSESGIVPRSIDEIIASLKSTAPTDSDLRIKELLESILGQDYNIKIELPPVQKEIQPAEVESSVAEVVPMETKQIELPAPVTKQRWTTESESPIETPFGQKIPADAEQTKEIPGSSQRGSISFKVQEEASKPGKDTAIIQAHRLNSSPVVLEKIINLGIAGKTSLLALHHCLMMTDLVVQCTVTLNPIGTVEDSDIEVHTDIMKKKIDSPYDYLKISSSLNYYFYCNDRDAFPWDQGDHDLLACGMQHVSSFPHVKFKNLPINSKAQEMAEKPGEKIFPVSRACSREGLIIQESEEFSLLEGEHLPDSTSLMPKGLKKVTKEESKESLYSDMDLSIKGTKFTKVKPAEIQKSLEDFSEPQPVSLLSTWTTKIKDVDYPLIHLLCTACPRCVLPVDLQFVSRVCHTLDKKGHNILLPPINLGSYKPEELFPAVAALEEKMERKRSLMSEASSLLTCTKSHLLSLKTDHIKEELNRKANWLSRTDADVTGMAPLSRDKGDYGLLTQYLLCFRICNEGLPISEVYQCSQEDGVKILPPPKTMPEWKRVAELYVEKPQLELLGKKVTFHPGSLKMFWTPAPQKFSAPLSVMKETLFSKYESNVINGVICEDFSCDLREEEESESDEDFDNLLATLTIEERTNSCPQLSFSSDEIQIDSIKRSNSAPELSSYRDKTRFKISADFKTTMEEIRVMKKHISSADIQRMPEEEVSPEKLPCPIDENAPGFQIISPTTDQDTDLFLTKAMKGPAESLLLSTPEPEPSLPTDTIRLAEASRKAGIKYIIFPKKVQRKKSKSGKYVTPHVLESICEKLNEPPRILERSVSVGRLYIHNKFIIKVSQAVRHYRSPSLPCHLDFEKFVEKKGRAPEDSDDYLWVKMIWNKWFDELYPPSTPSTEDMPASSRKDFEEETKEKELTDTVNPLLLEGKTEENDQCQSEIERITQQINEGYLSAFNYCRRGAIYRKIGKMQAAMEDLEKAISLEPTLVDAYWHRHLLFIYQNKILPALEDLNFIIKYNKNNAGKNL
ncbi:hypothetical protein JD844_021066 [Phrynosoma platyrhinos]|uniref:Uncharacterized protein n=1 Tax=Phrynosoma platyrhinos TaxID=52577 RepID=A0ABQ7STA3_PHRPL|nr:hypothetical protein JD844_021066 [Phrynosoma platyrhinos]